MTSSSGLVQSGTRTFVVGTVSGIDTSALVEIAVQAVTEKADEIDVTISENSAKVSAYGELKTLSQSLQTSLDRLAGNATLFDTTESVFDARSGTISTNDGTSPSGILGVSIDDTAALGSYDIEIIQQATSHRVISTGYADADADLNHAGTFDLGVAGGPTANIGITADMSLNEIAEAINLESETTGVTASVLKTSETEYKLLLTATDTAVDIEITGVTGDDVMTLIGVSDGAGGFNDVLQNANNAQIELDGTLITRNSNDFSDLLTGVGLTIENESPGTVFTLEIGNDSTSIREEIEAFVTAYNDFRTFVSSQSVVSSDGAVSADSILFSDNLMETLDLYVTNMISGSAGTAGSSVLSLRDLGIDLDANLNLVISDSLALDNAIIDNLEDVRNFFSSTYSDDNENFALLGNTSTQGNLSFALDITHDGSDITSVSVGGDTTQFTISGNTIRGAEGTIYEGLRFSYNGSVSTTVNIDLTQGMGVRLDNVIEDFAVASTGLFDQEMLSLESQNDDLTDEATRIREIGEEVREREIERYAEMEALMQANELLVRQIKAIFGTDDDE